MYVPNVPWRPLTDWELRIIERLLSKPFPGRDELLTQLEQAVASSKAEDGTLLDEYGSIYLKTLNSARASVRARVPTEGYAPDIDGIRIHYLLFVNDEGLMYMLEIHKEDPREKIIRHAQPEELKLLISLSRYGPTSTKL